MLFQEGDIKSSQPITDEMLLKIASRVVSKTTNFFPDLKFAQDSRDTSSFEDWIIPKKRKLLYDEYKNFNNKTGEWHGGGTGRHRLRAMVALPSPPGKDHVQLGIIPHTDPKTGKTFYKAGFHVNYIGRLHVKTEQARMIATYVKSKLDIETPTQGEDGLHIELDMGPYSNETQGGMRMLYAVKWKKCECKNSQKFTTNECPKCCPYDRVYKPFVIFDCDGKEDRDIAWVFESIESHVEKYLERELSDFDTKLKPLEDEIIKLEGGDSSVRRLRTICDAKLRSISSEFRNLFSKSGSVTGWEKINLVSKDDEEFLGKLRKENKNLDMYKVIYVKKLLQRDLLKRDAHVQLSEVDPAIISVKAACIRSNATTLRQELFKPPPDCRLDIRKFTKDFTPNKTGKSFKYMSLPEGPMISRGQCKVNQYIDPTCKLAGEICDSIRNISEGNWDDVSVRKIFRKQKTQYIVELLGGGQFCLKKGDYHGSSAIFFVITTEGIQQKCRCHKDDYGCRGWGGSSNFTLLDELRTQLFYDLVNEDVNFLKQSKFAERYKPQTNTFTPPPKPQNQSNGSGGSSTGSNSSGSNQSNSNTSSSSNQSNTSNTPPKPTNPNQPRNDTHSNTNEKPSENSTNGSPKPQHKNSENSQDDSNSQQDNFKPNASSQNDGDGENDYREETYKSNLDDIPTPTFTKNESITDERTPFNRQCCATYDREWFKGSVERYPEETRENLEKASKKKTDEWKSGAKRGFDESNQNKESRQTGNRKGAGNGKRAKTNSGRKFYTDENGQQHEITINEKNQGASKNTTAVLNDGIIWGTTVF
jgi:hypothetical protein